MKSKIIEYFIYAYFFFIPIITAFFLFNLNSKLDYLNKFFKEIERQIKDKKFTEDLQNTINKEINNEKIFNKK